MLFEENNRQIRSSWRWNPVEYDRSVGYWISNSFSRIQRVERSIFHHLLCASPRSRPAFSQHGTSSQREFSSMYHKSFLRHTLSLFLILSFDPSNIAQLTISERKCFHILCLAVEHGFLIINVKELPVFPWVSKLNEEHQYKQLPTSTREHSSSKRTSSVFFLFFFPSLSNPNLCLFWSSRSSVLFQVEQFF